MNSKSGGVPWSFDNFKTLNVPTAIISYETVRKAGKCITGFVSTFDRELGKYTSTVLIDDDHPNLQSGIK